MSLHVEHDPDRDAPQDRLVLADETGKVLALFVGPPEALRFVQEYNKRWVFGHAVGLSRM